jgi:Cu(I)/Ag(I) efflux system membrane protein CusA/SilA
MIRGRIPAEKANPLNRWLIAVSPRSGRGTAAPKTTSGRGCADSRGQPLAATLGGEFMPPPRRQSALYAVGVPGLSPGKAAELLQQTDRLIRTVPEVAACSARRDAPKRRPAAPLEMFRDDHRFKPRDQWRAGMTSTS